MELVTAVLLPKDIVQLVQPHSALVSFEPIVDQEINEDDFLLCSDAVSLSTDILSIGRCDEFSCSMGDDFLVGCVGVDVLIAVFVATEGSVDS